MSPSRSTPFGEALRQWRSVRRLSQLELASLAGTPPRHVSFLETGRARPTSPMVDRLAAALALPPDEHNALLLAAGLAPAFEARPLSHEALAGVQFVVQRLLASHAPYPALVLNTWYDVLELNPAARALFGAVGAAPGSDAAPPNLIELLLSVLAPVIENHYEVVVDTRQRLRRDLSLRPGDRRLADLLTHVNAWLAQAPSRGGTRRDDLRPRSDSPVLLTQLRTPLGTLRTLSALVHFGSATDVTVHGLHVELMYPADAATEAAFARLGGANSPGISDAPVPAA